MTDLKTMNMKAAEIPFATNGFNTPTIYCEDIRGVAILHGVAKINLVETRVDALTEEVKTLHVATIVVPVEQLKSWGPFLTKTFPQDTEVEAGTVTSDA